MFDYQIAKHPHYANACRAFATRHNLVELAEMVGMNPQMLRNKLNPEQPHRLTCDDLLTITDASEDSRPAGRGADAVVTHQNPTEPKTVQR